MVKAYLRGFVKIKNKYAIKALKTLVEIENCSDSINDFEKQVFNKDYAEYSTNKFKIINIVDENCKKYNIVCLLQILGEEYRLLDIVEKNIICFITPKRALCDIIHNGLTHSYYSNGQIKEKTYYISQFKIKTKIYYSNGNKNKIISYSLGGFRRNGIYKEWSETG